MTLKTPEQLQQIKQHAREIAKILYSDADPSNLTSLEGIETEVRSQILECVSPEIGIFLSQLAQEQHREGIGS